MSPLPPITTIFIFLFICFLLLFCVDSGAWPPMRARHLAGRPSIPSNADIPRSGRGVSSNRPQVRQISAACGSIFSTAPPTTLSSDIVMSLAVPDQALRDQYPVSYPSCSSTSAGLDTVFATSVPSPSPAKPVFIRVCCRNRHPSGWRPNGIRSRSIYRERNVKSVPHSAPEKTRWKQGAAGQGNRCSRNGHVHRFLGAVAPAGEDASEDQRLTSAPGS